MAIIVSSIILTIFATIFGHDDYQIDLQKCLESV